MIFSSLKKIFSVLLIVLALDSSLICKEINYGWVTVELYKHNLKSLVDKILHPIKSAFDSDNFHFYSYIPQFLEKEDKLLFCVAASGSGEIFINNKYIKKINCENFNLYSEKKSLPEFKFRLVIIGETIGWRGEMYAAYYVDNNLSDESICNEPDLLKTSDLSVNILSNQWAAPLVFKNDATNKLVMVENNQRSFEPLKIFIIGTDCFEGLADLHFYKDSLEFFDTLPIKTRKLVLLLFSTLGSGENEGTLHATTRLKILAKMQWLSVFLRPWAVDRNPSNSLSDVNKGLEEWAQQSDGNLCSFNEIKEIYPLVIQEITDYYIKNFQKSLSEALKLATENLELAYRSNFIFSHSS